LFFFIIREWGVKIKEPPDIPGTVRHGDPFRWLLLNCSRIIWIMVSVICLIFAWGGKRTVIIKGLHILGRTFFIGGMQLSVISFLYAGMVLIITHAAVRFWSHSLCYRIMEDSGLEKGLKNSIRLVTIYLFWTIGILIALKIMGLGTTSLTVAFGALGIGLGFGLQNIFNNFISGLILLFERPIQVGDAVEIDGTWGEVRKINVRSTLVQSYDNAALIIPNSDIISKQLINWSHKDVRIRRAITVGVAYGSDVEKVRETLLNIAQGHARVLKYPSPHILFSDFGESALVFKLRFWTDVDTYIYTETDIRFEIHRAFGEAGIEIPFPQRDLNFKTGKEEADVPK